MVIWRDQCALLKKRPVMKTVKQAESLLLAIDEGITDRFELAQRVWSRCSDSEAEKRLKATLSHLRSRHRWLEPGRGMELTRQGRMKVRELRRRKSEKSGDIEATDRGGDFDECP